MISSELDDLTFGSTEVFTPTTVGEVRTARLVPPLAKNQSQTSCSASYDVLYGGPVVLIAGPWYQ